MARNFINLQAESLLSVSVCHTPCLRLTCYCQIMFIFCLFFWRSIRVFDETKLSDWLLNSVFKPGISFQLFRLWCAFWLCYSSRGTHGSRTSAPLRTRIRDFLINEKLLPFHSVMITLHSYTIAFLLLYFSSVPTKFTELCKRGLGHNNSNNH